MSNFRMWTPLGDLDSVFALRTETDPSANPTGLYDPQGNDLCLRYKVYSGSGSQAAKTRFNVIQQDGTFKDLNEIFAPPKGNTWVAMGAGVADSVRAISAVDNSNVYVGGAFTRAGDIGATYIAKWDGATWRAMGTGTNNWVYSIFAYDNSNVYVGGQFTDIGGDNLKNRITKWDGTTWQRIGTGTNGIVTAIYAVDNSNVYVGGAFTSAGGIGATYIAIWDGNNWRATGAGFNAGGVNTISAVDNSNVYVGGAFTRTGDIGATYIAKWDGATWRAMGTGTNGIVTAICAVDNSNVYVGGQFANIGGDTFKKYFAKWDGTTWQRMGTGITFTNGFVRNISAVDNSNVYVGGAFTDIGGDTNKKYIVEWDGTTWQRMGTGITFTNGVVRAISTLDNSNLCVGGDFGSIGGDNNKAYIAKWTNNY